MSAAAPDGDLPHRRCLQSEQPKFPRMRRRAAGRGRRYAVYERGTDNRYQRQEAVAIKRRSDRAYDFVDEKGETQTVSFHLLGGNLFVGQAKADKDEPGYGYAVLRVWQEKRWSTSRNATLRTRPCWRRRRRGECPARMYSRQGRRRAGAVQAAQPRRAGLQARARIADAARAAPARLPRPALEQIRLRVGPVHHRAHLAEHVVGDDRVRLRRGSPRCRARHRPAAEYRTAESLPGAYWRRGRRRWGFGTGATGGHRVA